MATGKTGSVRRPRRARLFSEKRIYLKSDSGTRFVRLGSRQQALALLTGLAIVTWSAVATSVLLIDLIKSDNARLQAEREHALYEARLAELAEERDRYRNAASVAQAQFARALEDVSHVQGRLFDVTRDLEERDRGADALRGLMQQTLIERDAARLRSDELALELHGAAEDGGSALSERLAEADTTLAYLSSALAETAGRRDSLRAQVAAATEQIKTLELEAKLTQEHSDRIFSQLEDAVSVSMEPLDKMFQRVGMEPAALIDQMQGMGGQGGPLMPIALSTKGGPPDPDSLRANTILAHMDRLNQYRIAAEQLPFVMPIVDPVRFTSGFGYRRDPFGRGRRMHSGVDWAGAYGTPIYSSADGVVTKAGWQSGYGRIVTVQHVFGVETRYAHLSKINVRVGQRVSRGDRIGGMGNSGRSTGTHLHYEVRVGGNPVDPLTYIEAARDVL